MTEREKILEWCKKYCNNPNLVDENDFSRVIDEIENIFKRVGVTSESLSDMSQSFGEDNSFSMRNLLSPYKKLKMI